MGHRHLFRTSQMFEMDHHQNQNRMHDEQSYVHLGRIMAADNAYAFPIENMSTRRVNVSSNWNAAPRPYYQVTTSGPSHDPFHHSSAVESLCNVTQNYVNYSSSPSHYRHEIHGVESQNVNPTMSNGRMRFKRKRPTDSVIFERGGTSGFYGAGSSSNLSISSELPIQNPDSFPQHWPRNVRSHVSTNSNYPHSTVRHVDHSSAARWRILASDTSNNGSREINGHHVNIIPFRNPPVLRQNIHHPTVQAVRGGHNEYIQRVMPAYRVPSNYLQSMLGIYSSSTYSRPLFTIGWSNSGRRCRSRTTYNRVHSLSNEAIAHNRLATGASMMVDLPATHGSRNLLYPYMDMRLYTDNELLPALEEGFGEVHTGLSKDSFSKCLMETLYRSSDQIQEEEICVICLEEYKNKELVGKLTHCGHKYHMGCIRKWLSMKNVCPICKAPALKDDA